MAVQASPTNRSTARRPAGTGTGASSRTRTGTGTSSRVTRSTRRVAATSTAGKRQVAARAVGETQRVAGRARDQGHEVARTAREQGSAVARVASDGAGEVHGTVRAQAAQVRDELATQGRTVAEEARTKVQEQSRTQARRAGAGLSRLASEAQALADGRPEDAESLREYLTQGADRLMEAADRFYGLADEIDERGIEGVVSDLQRFARRRPGVFLLGAAVAGFGVGRAVRSAQADDGDGTWDGDGDGEPGYEPAGRRSVSTRRRALPSGAHANGGAR